MDLSLQFYSLRFLLSNSSILFLSLFFLSFFVGFSIQVSPALLGFVELASIIA